jgi:twinkle protein
MTELIHKPCPYEDCGSSDAFSYSTDKKIGYCHSCGYNYPSKHKMFDWAKTEYPTNERNSMPVIEHNREDFAELRGVTDRTMKFYNCLTQYDGKEAVSQKYIYPNGKSKYRTLKQKAFVTDPGFSSNEFYGMNLFNGGSAKSVTITEGELDAMSAFQMLGSRVPVVSLPSATPKRNILEHCKAWLDSFDKIYLSIDTDEKAESFAVNLMKLYPGKVYKVHHDKYKDANEFLQAGAAPSYLAAWQNARLYTPTNIINATSDYLDLYDNTPEHNYIPTNVPELDAKIMGLMQGHLTVMLAETGIGKSEMMRKLEYNFIKNYPDIVFATWHLEETKLRSVLGLVSYDLNDNLTRRDLVVTKGKEQQVRDSISKITQNGNYIQFSLGEASEIEDLIEQIRVLSQVYGCKYIFFEPIQDVLSISDEKEKESKLASLSIQLSKMASDLGVGVVTIAHTNENGDPKYCKMIRQRASVVIEMTREKDSDDPLEKNTLRLYVTKNRPASIEGPAGELVFDINTFTLNCKEDGF